MCSEVSAQDIQLYHGLNCLITLLVKWSLGKKKCLWENSHFLPFVEIPPKLSKNLPVPIEAVLIFFFGQGTSAWEWLQVCVHSGMCWLLLGWGTALTHLCFLTQGTSQSTVTKITLPGFPLNSQGLFVNLLSQYSWKVVIVPALTGANHSREFVLSLGQFPAPHLPSADLLVHTLNLCLCLESSPSLCCIECAFPALWHF